MQDADAERFRTLMQAMCATYRQQPSPALFEGYWLGLSGMSLGDFERAVRRALSGSKFMPAPAELRELGGELSTSARAVHAWNAVKGAIRSMGAYGSPDFDDKAINATIRNLGGWQRVCGLESEELEKWTRKEFEKVYATLLQSGYDEYQGRHLVGIHEAENGEAKPRLVLTGLVPAPAKALPEVTNGKSVLRQLMDRGFDMRGPDDTQPHTTTHTEHES